MKPVPFVFGVHCHQPVGNLETVFEQATREAYWPLFEVISAHPEVPVAVHMSGSLCEWLQSHHPQLLDIVQVLAQRKQIELLSSAFYEPVLTVIPESDREGQIRLMSDFLEHQMGVRAEGCWITERVWEPHLVGSLVRAGAKWAPIDDDHLLAAGLAPHQLGGMYLTEDEGLGLKLLPISSALRYAIPYHSVEDVVEQIVRLGRERDGVVCFFDDGEKFGLWPGSHAHVYGQRWLHRFFEKLEADDRIQVVLPADLAAQRPRGRIYVPAACSREMARWSLAPERARTYGQALDQLRDSGTPAADAFLRGGHWRNFLVRYPEANLLQKRATRLSQQLRSHNFQRGDRRERAIRKGLYRAQCNCAYWHGIFGGIYLRHLRHALWSSLIGAESTYFAARSSAATGLRAEVVDLEVDGGEEILVEGVGIGAWVKPSYAGALLALDMRSEPAFPLLNVMARYQESYHLDADLPEGVVFDDHRRLGLLDRYYRDTPDAHALRTGSAPALEDEIGLPMRHRVGQRDGRILIRMHHDQSLGGAPLSVYKTLAFAPDGVDVECRWEFVNESEAAHRFCFAPELNLALLRYPEQLEQATSEGGTSKPLAEPTEHDEGASLRIRSPAEGLQVLIESGQRFSAASYPIETWSQNEAGFERLRQGVCVQPRFAVEVAPGARQELTLRLRMSRLGARLTG